MNNFGQILTLLRMPTVNNSQKGLTSDICIDEKEKNVTNKELTEPTTERPPDVDRLRKCIIEFVHANFLEVLFFPMQSPNQDFDEMLGVQTVILLNKMDDKEKAQLCNELVNIVHEATQQSSTWRQEYERVIDTILHYAHRENALSINMCIEGLVMTADFSLRTIMDPIKWKFVEDNMARMDYKGIRTLFKCLIYQQLNNIPAKLSSEQRRQLLPIERILLNVLDTDRNVIPPIFTMTEVSRGIGKRAYMFPRLAHRLSELNMYFRPVAELSYAIGRCYMFPLSAHPSFSSSAMSWRIDNQHTTISHRSPYLPYKAEMRAPQTYLLYMVVRQPRGKEVLSSLMRQVTHSKTQWDELLSVLISETMAEVQLLPEDEEIPRYQWENLLSIIMYGITQQHINLTRLLNLLSNVLVKTGYRRARDEMMWIMLQIAGTFQNYLQKEQVEEMAKLYNLLFSDEVVWTGASDHPSQLVRFLAAACMWIILDGADGLPPPSECLATHIEFIRSNTDRAASDTAIQAVLDNAFRSDSLVAKNVHQILQQRLDGQPTDDPFLLPYGKPANNKLESFSMQFLDSLTLRAKNHLQSSCMKSLQSTPDRLPSPACADTLARIISSMDFDYGTKGFLNLVLRSITSSVQQGSAVEVKEQCYIYLDILCYRLPLLVMPTSERQRICGTILSAMSQLAVMTTPALYSIMEQILMRQWAWNPFCETMNIALALINKQFGNIFLNQSLFVAHSIDNSRSLAVCPEVVRMLLITLMRALKIMGMDISPDIELFQRINSSYTWPASQLHSLPTAALRTVINPEEDTAKSEILQLAVHADFIQMRGLPESSWLDYMSMADRQPTIFCVIFRYLIESPPDHHAGLAQVFYQIIGRQTARELILATNALTDHVISQCSTEKNSEEFFPMMVRVLNQMVFQCHVIQLDRLLLSLVMHPVTDHSSQLALHIVQALLNCNEIQERIAFYCRLVPKKELDPPEHFRRLSEYHRKFPEYTCSEMGSRQPMQTEIVNPHAHFPIYYGSLIERLLPIVDFTLSRALELSTVDNAFSTILTKFAPIYKYHPAPITFVYTILYCMHEQLGHLPRARQFVLAILCQGDDSPLTQSFITFNHQRVNSFEELVHELIDRVIVCSEFILKPPPYIAQDWRFAEYSPAAQALYLACIELLASPHSPNHIVPAMINLLSSRPQPRPYMTLNAIALLLTALPDAYCQVLQNEFLAVIDSGLLSDLTFEDIVFDNFEESLLLQMGDRSIVISVIAQAYWHHGNMLVLSRFMSSFVSDVCARVKTENELWYALRLIVPLLHRCYDSRDKVKHLEESLKVVSMLYVKIAELTERYGDLIHGDELCDLLYHFKYMFVGDFLKKEADAAFPRFSTRMRERLKFYTASSSNKEKEEDVSFAGKISSVSRPDLATLLKMRSDASEKAETNSHH